MDEPLDCSMALFREYIWLFRVDQEKRGQKNLDNVFLLSRLPNDQGRGASMDRMPANS